MHVRTAVAVAARRFRRVRASARGAIPRRRIANQIRRHVAVAVRRAHAAGAHVVRRNGILSVLPAGAVARAVISLRACSAARRAQYAPVVVMRIETADSATVDSDDENRTAHQNASAATPRPTDALIRAPCRS